jgi:cyclic pyranopterin phosphate synthase
MADVSAKGETARAAVAEGWVLLPLPAWERLKAGTVPKGDVFAVARVAGIQAAKETSRILPLCHPLFLSSVRVELSLGAPGEVRVEAEAKTTARTGVEMEALCAVTAAALCVYDMLKPLDKGIRIDGVRLLRKSGGKSGDYAAPEEGGRRPSGAAAARRGGTARASSAASDSSSRRSPAAGGAGPKRSSR